MVEYRLSTGDVNVSPTGPLSARSMFGTQFRVLGALKPGKQRRSDLASANCYKVGAFVPASASFLHTIFVRNFSKYLIASHTQVGHRERFAYYIT